jgi:CelD/BcsL family acetyltransferase involved in cellulose biosynthesis
MNSSNNSKFTIGKPITHRDQLVTIEDQWRNIYSSNHLNSIFISFEFICIWYDSFVRPEQVRVYPIIEGDKVVGYLPLFLSKKWPLRIFSSLMNFHCLQAELLISDGNREAFMGCCLDLLISEIKGWDLMEYHGGYSFQKYIYNGDLRQNKLHIEEHRELTYSIRFAESFEEYFNHDLTSKVRHNIRWWNKKLAQFSSYKYTHYTGQEAVAMWSKFISIEGSGWKGQEGSSIIKCPTNIQSYYEKLIQILADKGLLHMYFLEVEDRAVAGGFSYMDGDVFQYAKCGYVEDKSSFSPSNLLLMYMLKDLIHNFPAVKRLHMFPLDFGYKHRFANEEAHLVSYTLYSNTIRGKLIYYLIILKDKIKKYPTLFEALMFIRKPFKKILSNLN